MTREFSGLCWQRKSEFDSKLFFHLKSAVLYQASHFRGADVLITGGLGFIGSALARQLVTLEARVTLVDSLIPEYGGNPFNIHDIKDRVTVDLTDVRDRIAMASLITTTGSPSRPSRSVKARPWRTGILRASK